MPTDSVLEKSLRNAVRALYDDPDASVKRIRTQAETDLNLESGFFKSEIWKERSREIIQDQFGRKEEEQKASKTKKRSSPSVEKEGRSRKKTKVQQTQEEDEDESIALSEPPESEEAEEEESGSEEEAPKKKSKPQPRKAVKKTEKAKKVEKKPAPKKEKVTPQTKSKPKQKKKPSSDSEVSDALSEAADNSDDEAMPDTTLKAEENEDSSSELSSVIDDPEPARKRSKAQNGDSKPRKSSASTKTKPPAEADPNTEEIKRLQAWLAKCGIRKVWGKELKLFDTPKAKISHLKSLLNDAGMTGRYSNEKAAQIKEARELAADIEAVQEGNERWGKGDGEESGSEKEDSGRPKRRLVRGAANYDFLSSDGEETD